MKKLINLTMAAGRHIKIGGKTETYLDSRMADLVVDEEMRLIWAYEKTSDGKGLTGKRVFIPFEAIGSGTPMEDETVAGVTERRRRARESEQLAEEHANRRRQNRSEEASAEPKE